MNRGIRLAALLASAVAACALAVPAAAEEEIPQSNPLSGDPKAIASGRSWYRGVCALCHGGRADGAGERGNGADLRKFEKGFRAYVQTVKDGRKVPGRNQEMPAWGAVLDDKTIYEIGAYLETLAMDGANWKEGVVHR
jgi:mono/diheme cytochrome c family protein